MATQVSMSYKPKEARLRGAQELADLYGGITFDENIIRSKFDDATKAQYGMLNKEYATTENKYYDNINANQMSYLDAMRRANASAAATGASRGMAAANELSTILGLQQNSVAGATDLASQRNLLKDKEAASYMENAKNALAEANKTKLSLGSLGSELYNADTQFNVGEMQYYAAQEAAAKQLEAAMAQAEAQRYQADQQKVAAQIQANAQAQAAQKKNEMIELAEWMNQQDPTGAMALAYLTGTPYADALKYGKKNSGVDAITGAAPTANPAKSFGQAYNQYNSEAVQNIYNTLGIGNGSAPQLNYDFTNAFKKSKGATAQKEIDKALAAYKKPQKSGNQSAW